MIIVLNVLICKDFIILLAISCTDSAAFTATHSTIENFGARP